MFGQHQQQQQLAYQTNYDPTFPIPPIPSSSNFNNFHGSNSLSTSAFNPTFNNTHNHSGFSQQQFNHNSHYSATSPVNNNNYNKNSANTFNSNSGCGGSKTLWIGDIENWMDEQYVINLFQGIAQVMNIKLIKNKDNRKNSSAPQFGYGFVEFTSHEIAKSIFTTLNGASIPSLPNKNFKLNWASHQVAYNKTSYQNYQNNGHAQNYSNHQGSRKQEEYQIYVGDLDPNVNDQMLMITFQKRYPSVNQAKVIMDPITRQSKCYGFVKFGIIEEGQNAMAEMQGKLLLTKAMKINHASQKKQDGFGFHQGAPQMQKNFQYQNPQQLPYQQPFGQQNPFLLNQIPQGSFDQFNQYIPPSCYQPQQFLLDLQLPGNQIYPPHQIQQPQFLNQQHLLSLKAQNQSFKLISLQLFLKRLYKDLNKFNKKYLLLQTLWTLRFAKNKPLCLKINQLNLLQIFIRTYWSFSKLIQLKTLRADFCIKSLRSRNFEQLIKDPKFQQLLAEQNSPTSLNSIENPESESTTATYDDKNYNISSNCIANLKVDNYEQIQSQKHSNVEDFVTIPAKLSQDDIEILNNRFNKEQLNNPEVQHLI
eukprot:403335112